MSKLELLEFHSCKIFGDRITFNPRLVFWGVVSLTAAVKVYQQYVKHQKRKKWDSTKKDVVLLHGFNRAITCPNLSPFVVKLETYLRMASLEYEYDTETPMGPKQKCPWITLNGEDVSDSQLAMEYLGRKFNLNFSKNLTTEQKGAAKALSILADEHLFWGLIYWRGGGDPDDRVLRLVKLPFCIKYMLFLFKRVMKKRMRAQGIGHHSPREIELIMLEDIKALSQYLGEKQFLMGDEPCEADCTVFGQLSQYVWGTPGSPFAEAVQNEYRNLMLYCFRMKERFYPDWNDLLLKSL